MQWWLGHFGRLGRYMRDVTIDSLSNAHEEHVSAQAQITADHRRVYGPVNFSAQSFFHAALRKRPEVIFERPKKGAPQLPIVNGRVVIFWRYANRDGVDVLTRRFGSSPSRIAAFEMAPAAHQEVLDLDVNGELLLTPADIALLEKVEETAAIKEAVAYPVTVIAYSSNAGGLYQILCADADLKGDGMLRLSSIVTLSADLRRQSQDSSPAIKRFDQGAKKQFDLKPKTGNDG